MKFIKRITAALCAGAVMLGTVIPAGTETGEDTSLPSGLTVDEAVTRLEELVQENGGTDPGFASGVVGVFRGDRVLHRGFYGYTDMENKTPPDENSVYEWGSISKTLIWISAMQLWEQGQLDLERDIREYLPQGFFRRLSFDEPITMLELMNHSAGWQETTRPIQVTDPDDITDLETALQALEPAQVNRPGEVVAYSNYGACVAAYVIQCITGQDYCEYVHQHILEPLGMEHTALYSDRRDVGWVQEQRSRMKSYKFIFETTCIDLGNELMYIPAYASGSAAGTLDDLMTYAQALCTKSPLLFQSSSTWDELYTGTTFYGDTDIPSCAHGFWCLEYAVRTYGHSGGTYFGQANMIFDPESGTGLVVMVNEPQGNMILEKTPCLVFGELSPEKYVVGGETKELSGYYLCSRSTHRGMFSFLPYLTPLEMKEESLMSIGGGAYQLLAPSQLDEKSVTATLIGTKTLPDGRETLTLPSVEYVRSRMYVPILILLTLYFMGAVTAIYTLRMRRTLKKGGRAAPYPGSPAVALGQWARMVSVLLMLVSFVMINMDSCGIPSAAAAVIGAGQMLCAGVCALSALVSAVCLFRCTGKLRKALLAAGTVMNGIMVWAILFFELYRFWV